MVKTRVRPEWFVPPCGTTISACHTGSAPPPTAGRSMTSAAFTSPECSAGRLCGILTSRCTDCDRDLERARFGAERDRRLDGERLFPDAERFADGGRRRDRDRDRDLVPERPRFSPAEGLLDFDRGFGDDPFREAERFGERCFCDSDRLRTSVAFLDGERLLDGDRFLDGERFFDGERLFDSSLFATEFFLERSR